MVALVYEGAVHDSVVTGLDFDKEEMRAPVLNSGDDIGKSGALFLEAAGMGEPGELSQAIERGRGIAKNDRDRLGKRDIANCLSKTEQFTNINGEVIGQTITKRFPLPGCVLADESSAA